MAMRAQAPRLVRQATLAQSRAIAAAAAPSQVATLPDLPYDYSALSPVIIPEIQELHHKKHHQTYVTNLNKTLEQIADAEAKGDVSTQIALQGALKFNGGGHLNHSIFWKNLTPPQDYVPPSGEIASAIDATFGDLATFQSKFSATTAGVQGSGWGWLAYNKTSGGIQIVTTANQDPLEATTGLVPLLGVDVWEHAYYLQYKNVRPDYLKEIWKIINWGDVAERYATAKK